MYLFVVGIVNNNLGFFMYSKALQGIGKATITNFNYDTFYLNVNFGQNVFIKSTPGFFYNCGSKWKLCPTFSTVLQRREVFRYSH
jgi:hypothetical protein